MIFLFRKLLDEKELEILGYGIKKRSSFEIFIKNFIEYEGLLVYVSNFLIVKMSKLEIRIFFIFFLGDSIKMGWGDVGLLVGYNGIFI